MSNVLAINIQPDSTEIVRAKINSGEPITIVSYEVIQNEEQAQAQTLAKNLERSEEVDSIVSSVNSKNIIYNLVELPFKDEKKLQQVISLQVQDTLPFDIDEFQNDSIIVGQSNDSNYRILTSIIPKSEVENSISKCVSLGADPKFLTTGASALAILANYCNNAADGLNGYLEISKNRISLAIIHHNQPLHLRDFYPPQELSQEFVAEVYQHIICSVAKISLETKQKFNTLFLTGHVEHFAPFQNGAIKLERLDLQHLVVNESDKTINLDDLSWSLGLFASDLNKTKKGDRKYIDFRKGKFAYHRLWQDFTNLIQDELFYIILCLVLGLSWFGTKLYSSYAILDEIDTAIKTTINKVVPGEAVPYRNESSFMQTKVEEMEDELRVLGSLSSISTLNALKELTSAISPNMDVLIDSLNIGASNILIRGSVAKNPQVGELNKAFVNRKQFFCKVNVDNTGETTGGRYGFKAEIELCE